MLSVFEIVMSGTVGLSTALVGTYLHSRRKGAEFLDTQWMLENGKMETHLAGKQTQIETLQTEVDELRKPKLTSRQQQDIAELSEFIENADPKEIIMFEHLRKVEKISRSDQSGFGPLPPGFDPRQAEYILIGLREKRLVIPDYLDFGGRWELHWKMAPWAKAALEHLP